ncbi:hypothetical protein PN476_06655 [Dolichospermum circinale CS-537/05]|nr:hypothetical protein [Dolichospermum circinale CS-537/05]
MKKKIAIGALVLALVITSVSPASAGWFFGKKQYHEHAWSDGKCAYIRHYYETRFFGFTTGTGYYDEKVGCID